MTYNIIGRVNGHFTVLGQAHGRGEVAQWQAWHPGCFAEPANEVRSGRFVSDGSEFHPVVDWVDEDEEVCQEMYHVSLKGPRDVT